MSILTIRVEREDDEATVEILGEKYERYLIAIDRGTIKIAGEVAPDREHLVRALVRAAGE